MKPTLKYLVESMDVNTIELSLGEGVAPMTIEVGSDEYFAQENMVVGVYSVRTDVSTWKNILKVEELTEAEAEIEEGTGTETVAEVEEAINLPLTAVVFHRKTLHSTGRQIHRQELPLFIGGSLAAFKRDMDPECVPEDFAVFEVDFDNRTVSLNSITIQEEESDTIKEE